MKHLPNIAGVLLGLLFLLAAVPFLLQLIPADKMPPPPNEAARMFMGAFAPTGYLTFIKVLELIGGVLVMIPFTRNLGQLILGPIIVNIIAYHAFVMKDGLLSPMLIAIVVLSAYLLWVERRAWTALVHRS